MKHFYTLPLSTYHRAGSTELHCAIGNGKFRKLFVERLKKILIPAACILMAPFSIISMSVAQSPAKQESRSIAQLAGTWILNEAHVINDGKKVDFITKQESFWADHVNYGFPFVIDEDGSVTYYMDGQPAYAKAKIEEDNLVLTFTENASVKVKIVGAMETRDEDVVVSNFTIYKLRIEDEQFIIARDDPKVREEYTFKRQ